MEQLPLAISVPSEPTLDNYVPGSNAEVLARLRDAAEGTATEAVIYLWGEPGCGRTHLLRAAARAAADGIYVASDGDHPQAQARLIAADDVELLDDARQVGLFNLINRARDSGGTVVAAGSAPPAQLTLREDLKSRLGWGLVYQVRPLSDAEKALHLHAEAGRRGLRLSDEVVWYLLSRLPRDLPSLNAVLDRLDQFSLARRRNITLPLVREALERNER